MYSDEHISFRLERPYTPKCSIRWVNDRFKREILLSVRYLARLPVSGRLRTVWAALGLAGSGGETPTSVMDTAGSKMGAVRRLVVVR